MQRIPSIWVCLLTKGVFQNGYILRPPSHTSGHLILDPPPPGIGPRGLHLPQRLKALLHYALFHSRFLFSRVFLAFSLAFWIPTCWYQKRERKREKNARKTQEKSKTRAQRETMFLYYTMGWVKTRVSCVLVAFWSRFGRVLVAFWSRFGRVLVTNNAKTQTQRIV